MDCTEFVELVTAYLDGGLSPADEQRVLAHLDLCDGCSTYLHQIRTTIAAIGELPADAAAPPSRDRLLQAFRRTR
ncbi:MAG TPA: anti-sigma factor [Mycobacteriales bacterium]